MAIYAVALHVILLGLAPIAAKSSTADPFSIICHGGTLTTIPDGEVPSTPHPLPGHACEYCNLCSVIAPPPAPDAELIGNLLPTRVLHLLEPASHAQTAGIAFHSNFARGPPPFA